MILTRILSPLLLVASYSAQQAQPSSRSTGSAPEIDVALIGAAIALVVGGLFVLTAARRRKLANS